MNLYLDLETTIRCPVGNNQANPMWPGNYIVMAGWAIDDGDVQTRYTNEPLAHYPFIV